LSSPLVSIIIPTRNRAKLLEKSIRSCLNQTYKNIEIIVVDDYSSDDTPKVVKQLSAESLQVAYVRNETHKGLPASRNIGLAYSRGELLFFSEDDLILSPTAIEILVKTFTTLSRKLKIGAVAPRLKLVSSARSYPPLQELKLLTGMFNQITGEPFAHYDVPARGILLTQHPPATSMIPRNVFKEIGGYYTGYKYNYVREDSDIYFRMFKKGYLLVYQPKAVAYHLAGFRGGCTIESFLFSYLSELHNQLLFLARMYSVKAIPTSIAFLIKKVIKIKYWNNPRKLAEWVTLIEKAGIRDAYWKALNHYLSVLKANYC